MATPGQIRIGNAVMIVTNARLVPIQKENARLLPNASPCKTAIRGNARDRRWPVEVVFVAPLLKVLADLPRFSVNLDEHCGGGGAGSPWQ